MADNNNDFDTPPTVLLKDIQDQGLVKPLLMSGVFHLVLIALFSIGYIGMCMKYKTMKPKVAIEAEKEKQKQADLEAARKKKAEEAAKDDAGSQKTAKSDDKKKEPSVIKNTKEVIKKKPTDPSTLDDFDGDL